jgi:hypothetical protein
MCCENDLFVTGVAIRFPQRNIKQMGCGIEIIVLRIRRSTHDGLVTILNSVRDRVVAATGRKWIQSKALGRVASKTPTPTSGIDPKTGRQIETAIAPLQDLFDEISIEAAFGKLG